MFSIDKLEKLLEEGKKVESTYYKNPSSFINDVVLSYTHWVDLQEFTRWRNKTVSYFEQNLDPESTYLIQMKENVVENSWADFKQGMGILESLIESLNDGMFVETINAENSVNEIENIFNRFHSVVRQLLIRREDRPTLEITDEYDVQDLLHSLLKLYFDDIRPEEWTPSYAGSSSRMDFLLKEIKTVIEVKKTRETLKAKEVGEQLIIDIEKYATHPDCETLYCFVYDPEEIILNPSGLENDLSRNENINVKVVITPKF